MADRPKRLYKSEDNEVIDGVCGGIGDYFNVDPVLIRVLFVFGAFASSGGFVLLYIVLMLVMPEEKDVKKERPTVEVPNKRKNDDLHYARPIRDAEGMRDKIKRDYPNE